MASVILHESLRFDVKIIAVGSRRRHIIVCHIFNQGGGFILVGGYLLQLIDSRSDTNDVCAMQ